MDGAKQHPAKSRKRQPFYVAPIFKKPVEWDDAETLSLWRRHFEGDTAADHALFEHYAPLVSIAAFRLHRRYPTMFPDLEESISDGALGLLHAIRLAKGINRGFREIARIGIRKQIFREMQMRRWGGRRASERQSVLRRVNATLTAELGRLPDQDETMQRLRGMFTNPQLYVGDVDIRAMSQIGEEKRSAARNVSDSPAPLDQRLIDADVIRLAGKGLERKDRKILKALLAGQTSREISVRFGIDYSTVRQRINGLLWVCRCNADLAAYLGVEPCELPARTADHKLPKFPIALGIAVETLAG
jgi:RNA polymerase sigma factor (sigma-70 family)